VRALVVGSARVIRMCRSTASSSSASSNGWVGTQTKGSLSAAIAIALAVGSPIASRPGACAVRCPAGWFTCARCDATMIRRGFGGIPVGRRVALRTLTLLFC
jgi:hypothetical protein